LKVLGISGSPRRGGNTDLLLAEVGDDTVYEIGHYKSKQLEFAFTHTKSYGETYFSFVNGQFTSDGGTHQSAFREGVLKGVNEFFKKNFSGVDVREGFVGAVAIKLKSPVFESQTKNKLGNTEIRSWVVSEVRSGVVDFLHKNRNAAQELEKKIVSNERLRKELNTVKKEAKEAGLSFAPECFDYTKTFYEFQTKAGLVNLKVPRLRKATLETVIIERYRRRE